MTFRRALAVFLLLFVAASVVTLVGKELAGNIPPNGPAPAILPGTSPDGRQLVAYYFTGRVRCSSCRKIEAVSRETIEKSFPNELANARLRFLVVNVDLPEHRHFVQEFRLEGSSLVLVEMRNGSPAHWRSLPDVWTLVEDDSKLGKYLREEVASLLERN